MKKRKPAGKKAVVLRKKTGRRSKAFTKLKEQLLERRREVLDAMQNVHVVPNRPDAGEPGDLGDWASASVEMDVAAGILESETRELQAIGAALERIEQGSYGVCEDCGKRIPAARLRAMPYATLCVECKKEQERERPRLTPLGRWRGVSTRPTPADDAQEVEEEEETE
ncbi:MAG: TraR/DksA C4-type zinc finger protein [Planctomycetota bacterium]